MGGNDERAFSFCAARSRRSRLAFGMPSSPVPRSNSTRRWSRSARPTSSSGAIRPTRDRTTAVSLLGDGKAGHYVNITKWNKGNNFSRPHFHPNDRLIYVLSGTWWNGTGTAVRSAQHDPDPGWTFVTHHAKGVHWDGAKDEDAVLLIIGEGPGGAARAPRRPKARSARSTQPPSRIWRRISSSGGTPPQGADSTR